MSAYQQIASDIREMSAYAIANMGEGAADNAEAIAFYEGIREGYAEAIEYAEGKPDEQAEDEICDGAPDIYNHTRMLELIGTRTYLDTSELATGNADFLTLAGYVLYDLARVIVSELATYYEEHAEDEETEDED